MRMQIRTVRTSAFVSWFSTTELLSDQEFAEDTALRSTNMVADISSFATLRSWQRRLVNGSEAEINTCPIWQQCC
uniref:Uncharacterized protein n=1 Tax=Kalanchoe fedtschenkoi TaxID=63787 RepID=A0A7N1A1G4_KALFE